MELSYFFVYRTTLAAPEAEEGRGEGATALDTDNKRTENTNLQM
jgi:hypothetical protein